MNYNFDQTIDLTNAELQMSFDISMDANLSFDETSKDHQIMQPSIYQLTPDRANVHSVATPQNKLDFENIQTLTPKFSFHKQETVSPSELSDITGSDFSLGLNKVPSKNGIDNTQEGVINSYTSVSLSQSSDMSALLSQNNRQPLNECSNQHPETYGGNKRKFNLAKNLFAKVEQRNTIFSNMDPDIVHADSMPEFPVQPPANTFRFKRIFSVPSVPVEAISCNSHNVPPFNLESANFLLEDPNCNSVFTLEPDNNEGVVFLDSPILRDILDGKTHISRENVILVDSRYPYEFEGGHIEGAINIYTKESILDYFFKNSPSLLFKRQNYNSNLVVIFHCEFSQNRGPTLARFLRNQDRKVHTKCYPKLFYPEIYILKGGYKAFFELFSSHCAPSEYVTMADPRFSLDYAKFKKEQKSSRDSHTCSVGIKKR